jgi:chromosome segregation ATPase
MKDVKTMIKEEMEKYRDEDRQQEAGQCIMGEMRKDREDLSWKEKYAKEHKLRLEAEGETHLVKAVGMNSPEMKAANAKIKELQDSLDRFKKENNDCYNRIAEALEVNESHQKLNGKLQERLTELEEENKKMHEHFDKKIDSARKAGL